MASGTGNGQSSMGTSGIGSGSVGSPGSVVNGPVRVGMNPHLGQERRAGDVSSAFADMPQTVSKVNSVFNNNSKRSLTDTFVFQGYRG